MFGELPKIFDRNFTIGYGLPAASFFGAVLLLLRSFHLDSIFETITYEDPLVGAAYVVIAVWVGGIILLSLNHEIIRFFEGYASWHPAQLLIENKRRKFDELDERLQALKAKNDNKTITQDERRERGKLMLEFAERYPNLRNSVLPTTFGNVIRAFEKYPKMMYGIEATRGWDRLQAVIPKDFLNLVDNEKVQTDLWVNVWLLAMIFVGIYLGLALQLWYFPAPGLLILAIVVGYVACRKATSAAIYWGEMVKSAFDVYLPVLAKTLGYSAPPTHTAEHQLWDDLSLAFLYREKSYLPEYKMPDGDTQFME